MYNNCFVLGQPNKVIGRILTNGKVVNLKNYDVATVGRSFDEVNQEVEITRWAAHESGETPRHITVSLQMKGAMYNDLWLGCIDRDSYNDNGNKIYPPHPMYDKLDQWTDFKTISKSGGIHYWFGVNPQIWEQRKDKLPKMSTLKGTIQKRIYLDEQHPFDIFVDAARLVYEFEPWDINRGITDKTNQLVDWLLEIKDKIPITKDVARQKDYRRQLWGWDTLIKNKDEYQKKFIEYIRTLDPSCKRSEWFSIGVDICCVFGEENGYDIFAEWSAQSEKFQEQSCINTWDAIAQLVSKGQVSQLRMVRTAWDKQQLSFNNRVRQLILEGVM